MKSDLVDTKLAEYINNYPDRKKLKVMFMRESEGVEISKILIRVGGGWLGIDEFLDQYTPGELEILETNDPLNRFAARETIAGRRVETSPVRRSGALISGKK